MSGEGTDVLPFFRVGTLLTDIVLMYFSMGHMMWNWPVPNFFKHNHVAMGLLQLLLTVCIMVINQKFFISGTAVIKLNAEVSDEVLKRTVEDKDYEVVSILG